MANKLAVKILCYLMCAAGCFNGNVLVSASMTTQTGDENNAPSLEQNLRKKIIRVPYINQDDIVFGCEAVSATMVLQLLGYAISAKDFTDKYLERRDWYIDADGVWHGPDPNAAFPGDPYKDSGVNCGFGIFANGLAKSMNKILNPLKHKAIVKTGLSLVDLIENYIDKDIPVLVWATMGMSQSSPGRTWIIDYVDENSPYKIGDKYTWMRSEHCLVLVGHDDENYYFNDPYKNHGLIAYNKALVEQRFLEMGKQSVVVINKEDVPEQ